MTAFLDLFSGIGGFALAAYYAGLRFDLHYFSETDNYAIELYKKRFPDAIPLGDIKYVNYAKLPKADWLVTAGFPCQPHSVAGKQKGEEDERDLWPECRRMLRDLRPRVALFENVPGLFVSNGGRFFNGILSDISEVGYACEWQIISASDVGAPHLRKRVWIVCYTFGGGQRGVSRRRSGSEFADGHLQLEKQPVADAEIGEQQKFSQRDNRQKHGRKTQIGHGLGTGGGGLGRDTAEGTGNAGGAAAEVSKAVSYHADSARQQGGIIRQGQMPVRGSYTRNVSDAESERLQGVGKTGKQIAVTQREEEKPERLRHRSDWWATEPDVGRVAHGIPSRMDRLKCLGNSVVPQCPEMIFNLPVFNRFRNNFV